MKIKNKRFSGISTICLVIGACITFLSVKSYAQENNKIVQFGNIINEQNTTENNRSVAIKGKHFDITQEEINLKSKIYELNNSENPKADAIKDLKINKALYYQATLKGYKTSDSEVNNEIGKLKKILPNCENYDEIEKFISTFESEDNYWTYIRDVMKTKMTIQSYTDDLKKNFAKEKNLDIDSIEFMNEWNTYETSFENQLLKVEF